MSKSLGNSPEPLELIEKYGADGVRVGMLLSSPAGTTFFLMNPCVNREEILITRSECLSSD
jgi:valyl-tRNA synthetase